jgi:tetratricopeptide (TPR) repeat protein
MMPVSMPASEPASAPATEPASMPSTLPNAGAAMVAPAPAVTQPTEAAAMPTTAPLPLASMATTVPTTLPASQPAAEGASQPTSQPSGAALPVEPAAPPIADQAPPTDPDQITSDQALAEQLDSVAELQFAGKPADSGAFPLMLRHQAAILSACATLNPATDRFPRLIAEAMSQLNDRDGELAALLKAITINPGNEFAWNRRLELILGPMQSARQKIDYLRDVISRSTGDVIVPADVRAHAAYRCAQLLLDRGEEDAAKSVLADALREVPASVECLTLRYQMLPADAPRFERCEQLLDLLKANPLQAQYSTELADLIAGAGLVQESLPWYQLAVSTLHLQGDPARQPMLNWVAELFIGDDTLDGIKLNTALLQIDPTYTPAYFMQLLMVRASGDKDSLTKSLQQATNAMSNRVVEAVNAAAPADAPKATTRPISDQSPLQLPDLTATVQQIQKGVAPEVKQQFIEAVADMALLQGYFAEDADSASKLIDALSGVLPADAPELARLRGWNDLLAKKTDDAKAKFTPVAAQDPLAELGLVKAMLDSPSDRPTAESMARRLLQDHPSGLIGAMLWEQLHNEHVKLITTTQADALREAVIQFPSALFSMVDKPQTLYAVRVDPMPVGSVAGEPLLAQVSIRNIGDNDLTLGGDGVVKPELLFTLKPDIGKQVTFPAFETISGPTVLASHSGTDQIVRLDQTQLLAFLNSQPDQQFETTGTLSVNQTAGGVGGYQVQFKRGFFRMSSAMTPEHQKAAVDALTGGRPDQKIIALSQLQRYAQQLEQTKDADISVRQHAVILVGVIHRARLDPLPAVSAWAGQCEYTVGNPGDRSNIIHDLADDADWRHRQVALMLLPNADPGTRDQILAKLLVDTQSSVRAEAVAIKALLAYAPAVPPADAPAAAPAQ